jgi:hypothetical protein
MVIIGVNKRSFTMTIEKRKRGRPLGSCIDDSLLLAQVADKLVSDSKLKPTTAIKQVLASPGESPLRRLQSKWKIEGSAYLQKAQNRALNRTDEARNRTHAARRDSMIPIVGSSLGAYSPTLESMSRFADAGMAAKAMLDSLGLSGRDGFHEQLSMKGSYTRSLMGNGAFKAIQQAGEAYQRLAEELRGPLGKTARALEKYQMPQIAEFLTSSGFQEVHEKLATTASKMSKGLY